MTLPSQTLFRFFNEIGIIAQLGQTAFERVMPEGMTLAQFTILNHFIRLGGPKRPQDLARAFQVTKATMSSTLFKLETKGLIEHRPDPQDGRAKSTDITDAGRRMHDTCLAALAPEMARISTLLDVDAVEALVPALSTIRAELDKARD